MPLTWLPSLAWRVDGLATLMLVLVLGVGIAVFIYAAGYLKGHPRQAQLFLLLTLFMLAMVGSVLADDLILLFIFWELTSVLSFLLVGFEHRKPEARKAALTALLVTGAGGLALLAGAIMVGQAAGTSRISEIITLGPGLAPSRSLTAGVILIALGCFTKSAQFPFHFWLPGAMAAPAPVSAYLHSATMVKLGIYLLARLDPAFGQWPLWQSGLTSVGGVTAAWAMVLALMESDLKRILAWSTVAALGMMVMLVGLPGSQAPVGLAAFLLAHALYKAPLFFVAGNVEKATGTRDASELGGLVHGMPRTALAALLAGVGMAGLPLSLGYIAKAVMKAAQEEAGSMAAAQELGLFVSAVTVALAGVAALRIFWRPASGTEIDAREGDWRLTAPPLVLAITGIVVGAAPGLVSPLLVSAARAMVPAGSGTPDSILDFAASGSAVALTLLLGGTLYLFWDRIHRALAPLGVLIRQRGAGGVFEGLGKLVLALAARTTMRIQAGRMSRYTTLVVVALTAGLWALLLAHPWSLALPVESLPPFPVIGALLLMVAGAAITALLAQRALQVVTAGIVAYGSALLLLFVGAPDLALTQFAVETVFVIVPAAMLLRAWRIGRIAGQPEPRFRPGAAFVAIAFGAAITAITLLVTTGTFDPVLGAHFGERSVPDGYGRNVVNVILVDFRSLDTLGEAAVVAFALMATLPILRSLRAARPAPPPE